MAGVANAGYVDEDCADLTLQKLAVQKKTMQRMAEQLAENGDLRLSTKRVGAKALGKVGGFFEDFKNFINQGNVVDLAIAFIMGVAFSKIISSLVDDIFNPCISMMIQISMENIFWVMKYPNASEELTGYNTLDAAKKAGAITMNYGRFAETVIQFLIVALCLFFMMKILFMFKVSSQDAFTPTVDCEKCKESFKEGATRCPHCCYDFSKKKQPYVIAAATDEFYM